MGLGRRVQSGRLVRRRARASCLPGHSGRLSALSAAECGTGEPAYGFEPYISSLGYATSTDGVHFTWRESPLLAPGEDFDRYGLEDPRITFLEGRYWIVHTVLSTPAFGPGDGVRIGLASTTDFVQVEKHGVIGPPVRDKDAALFPRRIRGKLALLHRIEPDIQIIYFDDWDELLHRSAARWPNTWPTWTSMWCSVRPGAGSARRSEPGRRLSRRLRGGS